MQFRRILPYVLGLIVLAFALGSLPRGSAGGSLLFQATWLLYLIYLGPIVILALTVALVVLIGMNWRDLGSGLGFGIAKNRKTGKRRSRSSFIVSLLMWGLAVGVLVVTKGSILNPNLLKNQTIQQIQKDNQPPASTVQAGGLLPTFSSLVQSNWFSIALLGLLIVGGLVLVQSIRVSLKEMGDVKMQDMELKQVEGLHAVNDAMKLIDDTSTDPRSRIINCYHLMMTTVSRLGAPVSSDKTARELERAIRSTFSLTGPATSELTQLFEEARYSLHDIADADASRAHQYLDSIAGELRTQLDSWT